MRTIDAEELMWHKSSLVEPRDKTVSIGKPISEDEIYAYRLGWNDAIDTIMVCAPTVDAVEVVRCKDCKWRGHIGCAITIVDESDEPKDDDFCSWGERRGEQDE